VSFSPAKWSCAIALLCLTRAGIARGQIKPTADPCDGKRISAITFNPGRPPFAGSAKKWRAMARAIGLHHATTRANVIRTYMLLEEGDVCTEARRVESERILRALPFLADASVTALPDSAGGVRLDVATVDEIPALAAVAIRHGQPSTLALGNSNVSGLGLRLYGGVERGFAYRDGGHLEGTLYDAFGEPLTAEFDISRDALGGHAEAGLSHPFLTDLQRGSFQATFRRADDYQPLLQPDGPHAAISVHQERWSVGGVARTHVGGLVALLGGAAMGNQISPSADALVLSDTGAYPASDSALLNRYRAYHATRVGGLIGVRRVRYTTVAGYDALFAQQDVATGFQTGTLAAPGSEMAAHRDLLLANSTYAGAMLGSSLIAAQFESEVHRDFTGGFWDSTIGSGRAAWYVKPARSLLFTLSDEFSVARDARLPTQINFADRLGGLRGYAASRLAGAERNVVRAEARWAHPALIKRSDMGLALFADVGHLWAGDVPFGQTVSARSVGVSLLGAYPTNSKRIYRLDLAFPLTNVGGRGGLELRFNVTDPTSAFWREPNDVTRSRLAPVPSSLFAWPAR
jgi:hypothetical protein